MYFKYVFFSSWTDNFDNRSISDAYSFKEGYRSISPSPSPLPSQIPSPCQSPNVFLRVPNKPAMFVFDDTSSLTSDADDLVSRPHTPNILLTAPSTENTCSVGDDVGETTLGAGLLDGRLKPGIRISGGGKTPGKTTAAARQHTPPPSPFLTVPNCHSKGGKPRISDSHSLIDLQNVSKNSNRRSSCLSLNADAKGRRRKSPRRVNFDLS